MTRSEDRRRAVQGAWPRAVPLTRRERAAMADALESLRNDSPDAAFSPLGDALIVLMIAADRGSGLCDSVRSACIVARWPREMPGSERRARLIRARLALWLRARLRADRGDCGPVLCSEGHPWPARHCDAPDGGPGPAWCYWGVGPGERAHATRPFSRRITPLWERTSR